MAFILNLLSYKSYSVTSTTFSKSWERETELAYTEFFSVQRAFLIQESEITGVLNTSIFQNESFLFRRF